MLKTEPLYLSLDFGTSGIQAIIGHADGSTVTIQREPLIFWQPRGKGALAWELDAEECWGTVCRVIRSTLTSNGIHAGQVLGVGVTAQRFGLVLLDKANQVLCMSPNKDCRAVFQAGALSELDNGFTVAAYGRPLLLQAWPKLLWFREMQAPTFASVKWVASFADWLCLRLTNHLALEQSLAAELGLVDTISGGVLTHLQQRAQLHRVGIPKPCVSGSVIGEVSTVAANNTGLSKGTPVISCGADSQVALLSMGLTQKHHLGIVAGWSGVVQAVITKKPLQVLPAQLWLSQHVIPNHLSNCPGEHPQEHPRKHLDRRWIVEGNVGELGGVLEWICRLLFPQQPLATTVAAIDALYAAEGSPSDRGIHAQVTAPLGGAGLGSGYLSFPTPLSFEPPRRTDLALAAMESLAHGINEAVAEVETVVGESTHTGLSGGMSKSSAFRTILSDMLKREFSTVSPSPHSAVAIAQALRN